ncbi:hypothetical protein [Hymenobacter glacieicola]|uniref:Uncharacterized protein n=1 Tax=Hymenobacter glacieicola TaxID=1562124 RepID=A0ABQ1WNF3_9BACT|nr:hypothetical protein [Hymenobacter glacieicola]GGG35709.1 hypothetical protein GCM10011378_09960 [Hymenobacter glacieicola]
MVASGATPQAGRWYAACLYAGLHGWAVVRDVAQPGTRPGGPGHYQQEAAPGAYATHQHAQAAADQLNETPAPRLRPADRYGLLPQPSDDYHPHPWELKEPLPLYYDA